MIHSFRDEINDKLCLWRSCLPYDLNQIDKTFNFEQCTLPTHHKEQPWRLPVSPLFYVQLILFIRQNGSRWWGSGPSGLRRGSWIYWTVWNLPEKNILLAFIHLSCGRTCCGCVCLHRYDNLLMCFYRSNRNYFVICHDLLFPIFQDSKQTIDVAFQAARGVMLVTTTKKGFCQAFMRMSQFDWKTDVASRSLSQSNDRGNERLLLHFSFQGTFPLLLK